MLQKKRIAETLVEEGLITEDQLRTALQRQLIMGGKIGTNLIELKFVSDDQLEKTLAKIYRIPVSSPESFQHIPSDIINSIPSEIAVRHRLVPIGKGHKTLTIAMENPNNIKIIDELAFMTGCRIETVVASEARIAFALEKYYDHPRDLRYVEILRPKETERPVERPAATVEEDPLEATEYLEPLEESFLSEPPAEEIVTTAAQAEAKEISFKDIVRKLTRIESREEGIESALSYISQHVDNAIFFTVAIAEAKIWKARVKGTDPGSISDLKINFGGPSVFFTVKNSEKPFYGDITGFPFDDDFLSKIGRNRPLTVYVAPLMFKTDLLAILYIDNGKKDISAEIIAEINSIIEKISISFEILMLKQRAEEME